MAGGWCRDQVESLRAGRWVVKPDMAPACCPSCRRLEATKETKDEWAVYGAADIGSCPDVGCLWGADRCWASQTCTFTAETVREVVVAARRVRGRRRWADVAHPVPAS